MSGPTRIQEVNQNESTNRRGRYSSLYHHFICSDTGGIARIGHQTNARHFKFQNLSIKMRSAGEMDQADAELRQTICKVCNDYERICLRKIDRFSPNTFPWCNSVVNLIANTLDHDK